MNITSGPMLQRFSTVFSVPVQEVVAWVNTYVNHPEHVKNPEPTEQERLQSIKAYIVWRIGQSSQGRIAAFIAEKKQEAA